MPHFFPGFSGVMVGLDVLVVVWLIVCLRTPHGTFIFDAQGEKGAFEKLLPLYLRAAEFVLGLAAGSIVLLVGSSAFHSGGHLPWFFASPLFVLAVCIIYGILFMVLLIFNYEQYRHNTATSPYTRFKYTRNQALGFSSLLCFCIRYAWLVAIVTR